MIDVVKCKTLACVDLRLSMVMTMWKYAVFAMKQKQTVICVQEKVVKNVMKIIWTTYG